jgi:hypothetical protein
MTPVRFGVVRDIATIESELRLLAAVRRTAAEIGAPAPHIGPVDDLLDEWNDARPSVD